MITPLLIMLGLPYKGKTLQVRFYYGAQIVVAAVALVCCIPLLFLALLVYVWPPLAPGWLGAKGGVESIIALAFSLAVILASGFGIAHILRTAPIFHSPQGHKKLYYSQFDSSKSLRIGPFKGAMSGELVVRLRWRPQPEYTPRPKQLGVEFIKKAEPSAVFHVTLEGRWGDSSLALASESRAQVLDMNPRSFEGQQVRDEYEEWREIILPLDGTYAPYMLTIALAADHPSVYGYKVTTPVHHRIWVEMFMGYKLSDLKSLEGSGGGGVEALRR